MSRPGWISLKLAAVIVSRKSLELSHLSEHIAYEFDDAAIRAIWRKAKICLTVADIIWLKDQLLVLSCEAA